MLVQLTQNAEESNVGLTSTLRGGEERVGGEEKGGEEGKESGGFSVSKQTQSMASRSLFLIAYRTHINNNYKYR